MAETFPATKAHVTKMSPRIYVQIVYIINGVLSNGGQWTPVATGSSSLRITPSDSLDIKVAEMDRKQFFWVLLALCFTGFIIGCGQQAPLRIEVGFDVTPPNAKERAKLAAQMVDYIQPQDQFALRAVDRATRLITTVRPDSQSKAEAALVAQTKDITAVTDLPAYFETVVKSAQTSPGSVIVLLYSDAKSDIPSAQEVAKQIRECASELAKLPNLEAVFLIGAEKEARPDWEGLAEMLSPLGDRLIVVPSALQDAGLIMQKVIDIRSRVTERDQAKAEAQQKGKKGGAK